MKLTKKQIQRLRDINRSFHEKIKRLEKAGVSPNYLPIPIPNSELIKRAETSDLTYQDFVKPYRSFTDRSNMDYQFAKIAEGVVVPRRMIDELPHIQGIASKNMAIAQHMFDKEEYKVMSELRQGIDTGTVRTVELDNPSAEMKFTKSKFKTQEEFYEYYNKVNRIASDSFINDLSISFKQNMIRALLNTFDSDAAAIIDKINSMDLPELIRLNKTTDVMNLTYIYRQNESGGEYNIKLAELSMALGLEYQHWLG